MYRPRFKIFTKINYTTLQILHTQKQHCDRHLKLLKAIFLPIQQISWNRHIILFLLSTVTEWYNVDAKLVGGRTLVYFNFLKSYTLISDFAN